MTYALDRSHIERLRPQDWLDRMIFDRPERCRCPLAIAQILVYCCEHWSSVWCDARKPGVCEKTRHWAEDTIKVNLVTTRILLNKYGLGIVGTIPLHHPIEYQLLEIRGELNELLETALAR